MFRGDHADPMGDHDVADGRQPPMSRGDHADPMGDHDVADDLADAALQALR